MCTSPIRVINPRTNEVIYMPCGKCPECVEKIRNSWAKRLADSIHAHQTNRVTAWFVTLTYDNAHLPLVTDESIYNDGLGEVHTPYTTRTYKPFDKFNPDAPVGYQYEKRDRVRYTSVSPDGIHGFLSRNDIQLFFKRLRKQMDTYFHCHISYFGCGEYGGDQWDEKRKTHGTSRPHYHFIVYINDPEGNQEFNGYIKPYNGNKTSMYRYNVPPLTSVTFKGIVNQCWKKCDYRCLVCEPLRNVDASSRYVTKYILKEMESKKHRDNYCANRVPMFRMFSQHLGIEGAIQYLDTLRKDMQDGTISLPIYHKITLVDNAAQDVQLALPAYYSRYAFKELGYQYDPHLEQTATQEVLDYKKTIREMWDERIKELEKENPKEYYDVIKERVEMEDKRDMTMFFDNYRRDDENIFLKLKDAERKSYNEIKQYAENYAANNYNDFFADNPQCLDAQIQAELDYLIERQKDYPFEILIEECPF